MRGTKACKKFCVATPRCTGVSSLGLLAASWDAGNKRDGPLFQGDREKEREAGEGGAGEKTGERKSAGRRGNERILFFLYLSFPCYLPYDFLIHQNAGKIMFWAK